MLKKIRLRRGYLTDLGHAFDLARDMCCGLYPPDEIVAAMARITALRRETLALLGRGRRPSRKRAS